MKRIVRYLICIWGLSACDSSNPAIVLDTYQTPTIPDLTFTYGDPNLSKDSIGALLYSGVKYSGFVKKTNSDGATLEITGYHEGLIEGDMLGYYSSGQKSYIRPYQKGKKHGEHFGYYEDGSKRFHFIFENGKSEGNHLEWFRDGAVFKDLNYKNGRPFGSQKVWRADGKIRSNYVIRENGNRYGLMGIKRCTKLDIEKEEFDPYVGKE